MALGLKKMLSAMTKAHKCDQEISWETLSALFPKPVTNMARYTMSHWHEAQNVETQLLLVVQKNSIVRQCEVSSVPYCKTD